MKDDNVERQADEEQSETADWQANKQPLPDQANEDRDESGRWDEDK